MNNTVLVETEKVYEKKENINDLIPGFGIKSEKYCRVLRNNPSFASAIAEMLISELDHDIIDLNCAIKINCSKGDLKLEDIYFECKGFKSNSENKRLNFRQSSCKQYNDRTELKKYVKEKVFILHTFIIDELDYISFKFIIFIGEKLFDKFQEGIICSSKLDKIFNSKETIDITGKEVNFSNIIEEYKLFHQLFTLKKPELVDMLKETQLNINGSISKLKKIDCVNLLTKYLIKKKKKRKKTKKKKFERKETFEEKIDKERKLLKSQNDNLEIPFNTKRVGNLLDSKETI